MIQPSGRSSLVDWLLRSTFPRFIVIGATGYLVDLAVLELLTRAGGLTPVPARAISFAVALSVTWALSRFWGFRAHRSTRALPEAARYVGVQLTGGAANFITYAAALFAVPALEQHLFLPLALGSAVGLVINYAGARLLVFRGR
jgi:putative flippase GtrA